MRVITGSARGRKLFSPEGNDVRPTTDKVKESVFNIIQFETENATVLDLFSGSGQLGIEALSRGAKYTVFVDSSRKSLDVVKKNVELCRFSSNCEIVLADALDYLSSSSRKFDMVFLDPPYHKNLCVKALEKLSRVLNDEAVIVCETQNDEVLPHSVGNIVTDREYVYSAIKLTVYRYNSDRGCEEV